jgi:hypothetical protein
LKVEEHTIRLELLQYSEYLVALVLTTVLRDTERSRALIIGWQSRERKSANQNVITFPKIMVGTADELAKLADMKQKGILSEEEFTLAKARLLAAPPTSVGVGLPPMPVQQGMTVGVGFPPMPVQQGMAVAVEQGPTAPTSSTMDREREMRGMEGGARFISAEEIAGCWAINTCLCCVYLANFEAESQHRKDVYRATQGCMLLPVPFPCLCCPPGDPDKWPQRIRPTSNAFLSAEEARQEAPPKYYFDCNGRLCVCSNCAHSNYSESGNDNGSCHTYNCGCKLC